MAGQDPTSQQRPGDRFLSRFLRKRNARRVRRSIHERRPERTRAYLGLPLITAILVAGLALGILGASAGVVALAQYALYLPQPHMVGAEARFQTTRILDRNGDLLWEVMPPDGGRRTPIRYDDLPPHVIAASIAAEDVDFFENPGFEIRSILRAFYQNFTAQGVTSGASTITQQLVKNTMIPEEQRDAHSYTRKIKEVILAYQLTQTYSKEQILEMYLNTVYYGNLSYGIEAASQSYFGKSVGQLTLAEAAVLAGLPQSPTAYNPLLYPELAERRQLYVLNRMVAAGFVTQEQANAAAAEELSYRDARFPIRAPHFSFFIQHLLEEKYGEDIVRRGGLTVVTSLDPELQALAEEVVREHAPELRERFDANNAALVAVDPQSGQVLAMVGSVDFYDDSIDGQVNVAVSPRQPGSTIKPLVYAAAFDRLGYTPDTQIEDAELVVSEAGFLWRPQNWDQQFHGNIPIKQALGWSLNIPAIKTMEALGVEEFLRVARNLGIESLRPNREYGLSLAIGGVEMTALELTTAYAALANGGYARTPQPILVVYDGTGRVLEQHAPWPGSRVFSARAAQQLSEILSNDELREYAFGLDSHLKLPDRSAAAKTGTTDNNKDAWTIGYTPQLVTGVWVGNTSGQDMREASSSQSAGQIWHDFMMRALAGKPAMPFRFQ